MYNNDCMRRENKKEKRNKNIVKLRDEKHFTFAKIGKIMHISRQRAWIIYNREKKLSTG